MRTLLGVAGVIALGAATAAAQNSNDINFNNEGDIVFYYNDPSVGGPTGSPSITGDLIWKSYSGTQIMAHGEGGGVVSATMEIDSFALNYYDTDWNTVGNFYDMVWGPGVLSTVNPGNIEPDFFQAGGLTGADVLVSIGTAGGLPALPCPPPGYVTGYIVSFTFGSTVGAGIVVPATGNAAAHLTETIFAPGGMTLTSGAPGACGLGDYILQDTHSTNETQADDLGGISAYGGFATAGAQVPDAVSESAEWHSNFRERTLNIVGDSGAGLERGFYGGGATNGLKLPVSTGLARFSYEIRATQDAGVTNVAFAGTAISPVSPIAPPGIGILGGRLLVIPDDIFNNTFGITSAAGISVIDVCAAGDPDYIPPTGAGCFTGVVEGAADFAGNPGPAAVNIPVPASAAGISAFSQGAVFNLGTFKVKFTNRVTSRFL